MKTKVIRSLTTNELAMHINDTCGHMELNEETGEQEYRKHSTFVGVTAATPVKLLVKSKIDGQRCPYGDVVKVQRFRAALGWDYERRVRNLTGDAEFVKGPHQWAVGQLGHFTISKALSLSLQLQVQQWGRGRLIATVDGKRQYIDKAVLKPWQSERGENPSEIRNYSLVNIREVRIGGEVIRVESPERKQARIANAVRERVQQAILV